MYDNGQVAHIHTDKFTVRGTGFRTSDVERVQEQLCEGDRCRDDGSNQCGRLCGDNEIPSPACRRSRKIPRRGRGTTRASRLLVALPEIESRGSCDIPRGEWLTAMRSWALRHLNDVERPAVPDRCYDAPLLGGSGRTIVLPWPGASIHTGSDIDHSSMRTIAPCWNQIAIVMARYRAACASSRLISELD